MQKNDVFSSIRGFNYQPGYAATGVDVWRGFQADQIAREIARGKELFPHINTIRLWMSFDGWLIQPATTEHLKEALDILDRNGLRAIVTLFNGWHSFPEFGGITPEHMSLFAGATEYFGRFYAGFVEAVVGPFATDERVLAWDLCNEPFNCQEFENTSKWLAFVADAARKMRPNAPIGVSVTAGASEMERVEDISDVLMFHPYITDAVGMEYFRKTLDEAQALAENSGKELLATEGCWGSLNDARRGELVKLHLDEITRRGIGWLLHLLNHTLVADGHRPEYGAVTHAGYMAFIEADGSLRPHHGIVKDYM